MKFPFASLNWGVLSPSLGRYLVTSSYAGYGNYEYWIGTSRNMPQVLMTLADAVQVMFQQCVHATDGRAEHWLDVYADDPDYTEPVNQIWDVMDLWNSEPGYSFHLAMGVDTTTNHQIQEVWEELSLLDSFTVWADYNTIRNKKLNSSQRQRLDMAENQSSYLLLESADIQPILTCNIKFGYEDDPGAWGTTVNLYALPNSVLEDSA